VLYARDAQTSLPIASVTKLMTLYLAVQALQKKEIALDELVPVSEDAYRVNGSQIWLEPGERLSVDHLMKAIAIGSANDAAYALGEYIGGSEEAFVEDMNQTARALGMTHTHFANPHGLPQPGHYSSAADLGLLALRAVKLPLLLHYTSMWEDRTVRNGKGGTLWMINHNRLLRRYPGADGLKTGYTSQAGFCIVATAKRAHTRMIAVVLGAPSATVRDQDAAALMTWGFLHYRTVPLARRGETAGRIRVLRGTAKSVEAVYQRDRFITLENGQKIGARTLSLPAQIEAPVRKGQLLGHLTVQVGPDRSERVPVVADQAVARVGWLTGAWRYFWQMAGSVGGGSQRWHIHSNSGGVN
jgi:D-alanyl-D-alanine carboxypeptidase (penicillin-binding protein 5/6)